MRAGTRRLAGSAALVATTAALLGLIGPASAAPARPADRPYQTTIKIGGNDPTSIAIDEHAGLVWVANGDHVTEVSAVKKEVVRNIQLKPGLDSIAVDPGTRTVWVTNHKTGTLTELSEGNGAVVRTIQFTPGIATISDGVHLIDVTGNTMITVPVKGNGRPSTIHLPADLGRPHLDQPTITTAPNGRPWIASNLSVYNVRGTASIGTQVYSLTGISAGLSLTVSPGHTAVAAVLGDNVSTFGGLLYLLSERLKVLKKIRLPDMPRGIAIDSRFADAWVPDWIVDKVTLVNLSTGTERTLPARTEPFAAAVDRANDTAWIVNSSSRSLTVYHYVRPRFTTRSVVHAQIGRQLKFTARATGFPVPIMRIAGHLPPGVRSRRSLGGVTIGGTPDQSAAHHTYRLAITADNAIGNPVTQHLVIKVS